MHDPRMDADYLDPTIPASGDELSDEQHGELDPRMAYETALRMLRYVDAFNGQEWALSTLGGNVDRKNLGVALDNLQECAAMLLNQSDRLRAVIAADRAARPATGEPVVTVKRGAQTPWGYAGIVVQWGPGLQDLSPGLHQLYAAPPSPNGEDREVDMALVASAARNAVKTWRGYANDAGRWEMNSAIDELAGALDAARAAGGEEQHG